MTTTLALAAFLALAPEAKPEVKPDAKLQAQPAAPTTPSTPAAPAVTAPSQPPPIDVTADTPPPSTFDRQQRGPNDEVEEQGRSLLSQLVRTVMSLVIVVGLIYIVAKVGLVRWGRMKGITGRHLKVVERLQLDARNALYLVEVGGRTLLLGGGGDKGVQLVTTLEGLTPPTGAPPAGPKKDFATALSQTEKPREGSTPPTRDEVS